MSLFFLQAHRFAGKLSQADAAGKWSQIHRDWIAQHKPEADPEIYVGANQPEEADDPEIVFAVDVEDCFVCDAAIYPHPLVLWTEHDDEERFLHAQCALNLGLQLLSEIEMFRITGGLVLQVLPIKATTDADNGVATSR